MKLLILQKLLSPDEYNCPAPYDKSRGDTHPVISAPDNEHYQSFPAIAWVGLEMLNKHRMEDDSGWIPFKQKRLL